MVACGSLRVLRDLRVLVSPWTLVVNSCSCGWGEFEAGEVAGAGPVQRVLVPESVQAYQVERDGGAGVFEASLGQAAVAGAPDAGDGNALVDGAFDAGPQRVPGLEVLGVLGSPGGELGLVDVAGVHSELPAAGG